MEIFSGEAARRDGATVLRLTGDLDLAQADQLVERASAELRARPDGAMVLDCSDLEFCDSSGIRALLRIEQAAAEVGRPLIIRDPRRQLRRLLELVDLLDHFTVEENGSGDSGRSAL